MTSIEIFLIITISMGVITLFVNYLTKTNKLKVKPKLGDNIQEQNKKASNEDTSVQGEQEHDNGFNRKYNEDGGYIEFYKKNGFQQGELKAYNKAGILVAHLENAFEDKDGDGVITDGKEIIYDDGLLQSEVYFEKGVRQGFGIEYSHDGWIEVIIYYQDDEDVGWDNEENKRLVLREIKKYMNKGVNVMPINYIGLCESFGFDTTKFCEDPDFKF